MKGVIVLTLMTAQAATQPYHYPAKGSPEQRADYERGQATQARFEQRLFVDAGFQPLGDATRDQRSVKRALFEDPYMMLPVPGVEIERARNGSVTLNVIGRTANGAPAVLPASAWSELTKLEGSLFKPRPYVPWDPPTVDAEPPAPPPICHGWIVRFGSADETGARSGSWAECGSSRPAELAYAVEIARLAVSTRPACKFDDTNPFWSFNACFSRPSPQ